MTHDMREESFTSFFAIATGGFKPHCWQLTVALEGLPDVLRVPTVLGKMGVALTWVWRLLVGKKLQPLHQANCLWMRASPAQTIQRWKICLAALEIVEPAIAPGVQHEQGTSPRKPRHGL